MCNPPARPLRAEDWAYERRGEAGDGAGQESAAVHSMTLSARPSTGGGIVRPRAFAVLRLTTSSNFVGCSTGRSPGLAPFKILSTYVAARRNISARSGP